MNDQSSPEVPIFSASISAPNNSSTTFEGQSSFDSNKPLPRRHHHDINRHHRHHRKNSGTGVGSGRLWQLPQSSIQEYAAWIEQKPKETQTPSEQRFLLKFQRRMLIRQQKSPMESMKYYIARLEAKENASDVEIQLIEQYHRRKANKRAQRLRRESNPFRGSGIPPAIFWRRESSRNKTPPAAGALASSSSSSSSSSVTLLCNMANLQESMNRMGLSSDKLRDIPMDHNSCEKSNHTAPTMMLFQSNPFST